MAFVVEDGTGLATANAYLSVEEANEYHKERGNAAWIGAVSQKQSAIIRATQYLDAMYQWSTGYITSAEQGLAWPRIDAVEPNGWPIGYEDVPKVVKHATAELALRAISAALVPDGERDARRKKVGDLEIEYEPGGLSSEKRYPIVDGILRGVASSKSPKSGATWFDVERA